MSEISIIVPVYNVEKYLIRCVDSILTQTFQDIEIILVDDGSTDQSGVICDSYAKKDKRIRVIHKENAGLSEARNSGIEIATGDYIGFVDSDDYIEPDMYEVLYNEITSENADVAMCDLFHCYKGKEIYKNPKEERILLNSSEAIKMVFEAKKTSVTAVNKLYKKNIFDNVRYPKGKIAEDAFVIVDILMQAERIIFTSKQEYYYVHRRNSTTTSDFKLKDLDVIEAYEKNWKIIKEKFPELNDTARMRYLWAHFYVLDKMMLFDGKYDKKIEKRIVAVLRNNFVFIMKNECFNNSRKIAMMLLMVSINLYKFCVKANRKEYID